jgi:hypothetical protein
MCAGRIYFNSPSFLTHVLGTEARLEALRIEEEQERLRRAEAEHRENERLSRMTAALMRAEDDAILRVSQLVELGCSSEQLEAIFSSRVLEMQRREARNQQQLDETLSAVPVAEAVVVAEPVNESDSDLIVAGQVVEDIMAEVENVTSQQEARFAAAEAEEQVPSSLEPSLLGASFYDSDEAVTLSAPSSCFSTQMVDNVAMPEPEPEPALEAPAAAVAADAPSMEQEAEVEVQQPQAEAEQEQHVAAAPAQREEEDDQPSEFAIKLGLFYMEHNPSGVQNIPKLIKDFSGREDVLNQLLMVKYGCDLLSIRTEPQLPAPAPAAEHIEAPVAAAHVDEALAESPSAPEEPQEEEDSEEMRKLFNMGFDDRERNAQLLLKHSNDVSRVIDELLA